MSSERMRGSRSGSPDSSLQVQAHKPGSARKASMQGTNYIRGWGALLWLLPGCISLDGLIDRDAGHDAGDETELDPTDAGLWPDSETNPSEADAGGNVPPD